MKSRHIQLRDQFSRGSLQSLVVPSSTARSANMRSVPKLPSYHHLEIRHI